MKKNMYKLIALFLSLFFAFSTSVCSLADEPNLSVYGEGKYPITEEPIVLKAFATRIVPSHSWDIKTNWTTKFMEQVTNIHIEWEEIIGDENQQAQKLNLKLISGDYPDIFLSTPMSRAQLQYYGSLGTLIPLNDLIEKYAPNFKKVMEENPGLKESITAPDGNIYGLPSVSQAYHTLAPNKTWVYKPWMEKLGLEYPKTTEDLYNVLLAFRDNDPNGNGKKDEIPIASPDINGIYNYIMNAFVYYDGTYTKLEDGKISFIANTNEFKEGLRYLHKLYSENLIIQNIYTMDKQQLMALTMADTNIVGAVSSLWMGGFVSSSLAQDPNSRFWEFTGSFETLAGPTGIKETVYKAPDYVGNTFSITNVCKYPVEAIKWVDFIYNIYNDMNVHYGPQWDTEEQLQSAGYGWRKAQEGELGNNGKPAIWKYVGFQSDNNAGYGCKVVPSYQPSEMHSGQVASDTATNYEGVLWQVTDKNYMPYAVNKSVPGLYMDEDASSTIAEYQVLLKTYVAEKMALFVTGELNIDNDWDSYVNELNALGVNDYLKIYQEQFDKSGR